MGKHSQIAQYEEKFIVLPIKYIDQLDDKQRYELNNILEIIASMRIECGKDPHPRYIICNEDETYAGRVLKIILTEEYKKKLSGVD